MKMWSMNVMILLLFCYACLSTSKGNVFFVSKNFFNVLHWDSPKPGQKLFYSVRNQRYGEDQYNVKHCQNITTRFCDLTDDTTFEYNVQYVAEVLVTMPGNETSLGKTMRFNPIAETTLGSPTLSIDSNASALFVNATPPLGPKNESIAEIIARNKNWGSRPVFEYSIKVTHPEWGMKALESTSGQFVINLKSSPTQYCGFVVYRPSVEWGREESEEEHFCVMMAEKPRMFSHWVLLGVACLVALIIVSVASVCVYVKGGKPKNRPQALGAFQKITKIVQFPDKNLIISEAVLCSQSEKHVPKSGSEGYSPQDVPWQDIISVSSSEGTGPRSSTPNTSNNSAQSSDIYSSVVAVHVPDEPSEDREPGLPSIRASWDETKKTPLLFLKGPPPLTDHEGDPDRPIMLQTIRNSDGQLTLPSLTLQLQSSDGDPASPVSPERTPLLSDLIDSEDGPSLASLDMSDCSDSGCDVSTLDTPTQPYCNSSYLSSQFATSYLKQGPERTLSGDSSLELGYTPNWMTASLHDTPSTENVSVDCSEYRKTNFPWNWNGYKRQEEEEDNEGNKKPEGLGQISLGSWGLQIQD